MLISTPSRRDWRPPRRDWRPRRRYSRSYTQASYYEELLEAGAQVHLYRGSFHHAKHLSVDDVVALIGTSNLDIRSFALNAEVMLMVYGRGVTARLAAEQERYFANSRLLTLAEWRQRPFGSKVAQNLARLLSPLL
jgi:cardiolipin synthase